MPLTPGVCARRPAQEAGEPAALGLHRSGVPLGQPPRRLHDYVAVHDPPGRADEAADQQVAEEAVVAEAEPRPVGRVADPRAVGVERKTLSYSGRKRTGAGVSGSASGASGRSKSSTPFSSRNVRSPARRRSTTSRTRGQPGPHGHVLDARRPERAQVAQHGAVGRRVAVQRPARARSRRSRASPARCGSRARAAGSARGEEIGDRVRHRLRVAARPALGEESRICARVRGSSSRNARPAATTSSARRRRAACRTGSPSSDALGHRLDRRAEGEAVACGDEVDRPAHERQPHGLARLEQPLQLLGAEALEPRPERDVRILRLLRLQADEVLDRLGGRPLHPPEQELPLQQGPIQLPRGQSPRCRAITIR